MFFALRSIDQNNELDIVWEYTLVGVKFKRKVVDCN